MGMAHNLALGLLIGFGLGACAPERPLAVSRAGPFAPGPKPLTASDKIDGLAIGHQLMQSGEYDLALRSYYLAADGLGLNADVLSAIGSANLKLGRLNQANTILRQALAKDARFVPALNNLGVVLLEQGRPYPAQEYFRRAFALSNGRSDAVRENLRRAMRRADAGPNPNPSAGGSGQLSLLRRGPGDYLLLTTSGDAL